MFTKENFNFDLPKQECMTQLAEHGSVCVITHDRKEEVGPTCMIVCQREERLGGEAQSHIPHAPVQRPHVPEHVICLLYKIQILFLLKNSFKIYAFKSAENHNFRMLSFIVFDLHAAVS
jgi:hypothetical protein